MTYNQRFYLGVLLSVISSTLSCWGYDCVAFSQAETSDRDTIPLNEVTATGVRQLFKIKSDRYVFYVASDSTLQELSTFDAFKKIPILNVNLNGSISSMQGKTLIYKLNGLRDPLLQGDLQSILLSLRAKYVKRIEFVENPDGDNPNILEVNIITKGRIEGYQARVTTQLKDYAVRPILWGMTKIQNFCVSGSFYYMREWGHDYQSKSDEWRYDSANNFFQHEDFHNSAEKLNYYNGEASLSYEFSDQTFLSASGRILHKTNGLQRSMTVTNIYDNNMNLTAAYSQNKLTRKNDTEYSASLSFEHLFGIYAEKGKFYLGYEYYYRPFSSNTYSDFTIDRCDDHTLLPLFDTYHRKQYFDMVTHTLSGELRRVIKDKHTIYSTLSYRYRSDNDGDSLKTPIWSKVNLIQHQTLASLSYKFTVPQLTLRGGIAAIMYNDNIKSSGESVNYDFSRTSLLWNPTVSATYMPRGRMSYELSYGMTSQVPGVSAMNPYVYQITPNAISFGNPELSPETTHQLSLGTEINLNKTYIGITLTGQHSENLILQYYYLDADGTIVTTYDNIAARQVATLSPFISWHPSRVVSIRGNLGGDYVRYHSKRLKAKNTGWQGQVSATMSLNLPWELYIELSGRYNTPWIGLQGKGGSNYGYSLSLSRSFLSQRLLINLDASSFLPIYYSRTYNTISNNYFKTSKSRQFHAGLMLSISYRFGHLRASVRQSDTSISNDDIKQSYDE